MEVEKTGVGQTVTVYINVYHKHVILSFFGNPQKWAESTGALLLSDVSLSSPGSMLSLLILQRFVLSV